MNHKIEELKIGLSLGDKLLIEKVCHIVGEEYKNYEEEKCIQLWENRRVDFLYRNIYNFLHWNRTGVHAEQFKFQFEKAHEEFIEKNPRPYETK